MAEVGAAFVTLAPSARGFGKKLDADIGPQLDKSGKAGSKRLGSALGSGLKSALTPALAILGTAGVGSFLKGAIDEAREAQKVGALTNAVIKSTGGIANVTAKDVDTLSTALSNKIGVDDEAIASGQNMLLTFRKVRNEAGLGNDIFNQATIAASDMAAAFGGDAVSNSKMLGKALNDPTRGVSALTRVGVSFTQQQKDQIKVLQESGDVLGAQKIILGEVSKQTEGAAEATATSGDKMRVAFGNLQETVGTALLPVIDKLATKLGDDIIPTLSEFVSGMQDGTGAGGEAAETLRDLYAAVKPVGVAIKTVVTAFAGLPGASQKVLLLAGAALLLKNRFGDSLPTMQSFSREATVAAAKGVAIKGGAVAAGVGLGMLSAKAGGASTTLGSLALVGAGVATGFAVGGPWGAAIGGGAALLSVFTSKSNFAADSQVKFKTAADTVVGSLNVQTGALTKNTRATTAKALADSGAFDAAKKVGVSYRDVLAAALGNEAATKRVHKATDAYVLSQKGSIGSAQKAVRVAHTLTGAVGATSAAISVQRTRIGQVDQALGKLDGKKARTSVEVTGLGGALANIASLGAAFDRLARKNAKVKVGANAKGTDFWRGGLTMVGEEGPELINLARGAQVIPNHKLGDLGSAAGGGSGSLDGMSPIAIREALDGMSLEVELTGGDRAKARFVQAGLKAGARL